MAEKCANPNCQCEDQRMFFGLERCQACGYYQELKMFARFDKGKRKSNIFPEEGSLEKISVSIINKFLMNGDGDENNS
jgi:hypothetical protein